MQRIALAAIMLALAAPAFAGDAGGWGGADGRIVLEVRPSARARTGAAASGFTVAPTAVRAVVATRHGTVRRTPGADGAVVGRTTPGLRLAVTGQVRGGAWYEVETGGGQAYVAASPVARQAPRPPSARAALDAAPNAPPGGIAADVSVRDLLGRVTVLQESGDIDRDVRAEGAESEAP